MHPDTLIAENRIRISRTLFNEGMRAVEDKHYKKSIKKILLVLAVLYLLVAVWLLHTGGSLFYLLVESVFLGAMFFWAIVVFPGSRRRRKYKAMAPDADCIPERTIKFYQDHLSVTADSGKVTVITYDMVTGWKESKNLYILNCSNNTGVLISKNGFLSGNFDIIKSRLFCNYSAEHDFR